MINSFTEGHEIYDWVVSLFPICRSLSGEGNRATLRFIRQLVPEMRICRVASGSSVFDWEIPLEWNIKDAYIEDETSTRIIDFKDNNLHVVGYSTPVNTVMSFEELDQYLHSLPDQPDAIPYITSYYKQRWGFCLSHHLREKMRCDPLKKYKVKIDSTLESGEINYGELIIPGESEKEILLSTYICHPSMANNELSGLCVTTRLAKWLSGRTNRYTYRILFLPETIGAIAYLSKHLDHMKKNTVAGFVISCVGDTRTYSYIESRLGDNLADQVVEHVLSYHYPHYNRYSFLERGSDERQYCAPGVDLPVCGVCRSKYAEYPEYHTSLDNLDIISPEGLQGSYDLFVSILETLEYNYVYKSTVLCEPQLGKRGLYPSLSTKESNKSIRSMINLIAYSDGNHSLLDIAKKIKKPAVELYSIAEKLKQQGLFDVVSQS